MSDRRASVASVRSVRSQESSGRRPSLAFLSKLKMSAKSEPPQQVESQEPVVELSIRNYMAIVMNTDKDVLVEYYTSDVLSVCGIVINSSVSFARSWRQSTNSWGTFIPKNRRESPLRNATCKLCLFQTSIIFRR